MNKNSYLAKNNQHSLRSLSYHQNMVAPNDISICKNAKEKSPVWQHFGLIKRPGETQFDENTVACKICRAVIKCSGGTTNLTRHLWRHHPNTLSQVSGTKTKAPTDSKLNILNDFTAQKTQSTIEDSFARAKNYPSTSQKAQRITSRIARFIVKDMRPYSIVKSKKFKELLAECEPCYQVPDRKKISDIIVPQMYSRVYGKVKADLIQAEMVRKNVN